MSVSSFNREFLRTDLRGSNGAPQKRDDDFKIKAGKAGRMGAPLLSKNALSKRLAARIGKTKRARFDTGASSAESYASDPRQRAVVKAHYFSHAGGGAAALRAHGKYIDRDGVEREVETDPHATYLSREEREGFYGPEHDKVDGKNQLAEWAREDPRHFRLILAPEQSHALGDLRDYTREVMARAEGHLERPLKWVAVDHHDTDNPHTHIVLRGRDGDGRVLGLPREFVKHSLRDIARDVATERLGPRTRDQDREMLERETRAHRVTRLDRALEMHLGPDHKVRLAVLGREGDPAFAQALQARVVELGRLGLAEEDRRGQYTLAPDWKERLSALEAHIDIRKQVLQDRAHDKAFAREARALVRETGKPITDLGRAELEWKVRREVNLPGGKYLGLEKRDRVALVSKPAGMEIAPGQSVAASMKSGVAHIAKTPGLER